MVFVHDQTSFCSLCTRLCFSASVDKLLCRWSASSSSSSSSSASSSRIIRVNCALPVRYYFGRSVSDTIIKEESSVLRKREILVP